MEKLGFWKGFVKSVCSFKDYPRYAKDGRGKIFLYTLLLTVLLVFHFIIGSIFVKNSIQEAISSGVIPHWNFNADNTLTADKKMIFDGYGSRSSDENGVLDYPDEMLSRYLFIIDTDVDFIIAPDRGFIGYLEDDGSGVYHSAGTIQMYPAASSIVLLGKHNVCIYDDNQFKSISYSEMDSDDMQFFSYDNVMDLLRCLWLIIFVCSILFGFIAVVAGALIQTVIACVQNNGRTSYNFSTLYSLAIHARTLPTLIVVITFTMGIKIPFLWLINYIIGAFIMSRAIKSAIRMNELNAIDRTSELNSLIGFSASDYNTPFNNINGEIASYNNQADLSNNNSNGNSNDYTTPFNNPKNASYNDQADLSNNNSNGNGNDYTTPFNNPNGTYNSGDYGVNSGYHSNDGNNN